jgi:hypothetical protein
MRIITSRLAGVAAVAALSATILAPSLAAAVAGFGDVDAGRFYSEPIQWLVDEEITTGTSPGCFDPDRPVSRGEIATFLWRYAGRPAGDGEPFSDVDPTDFFADAVGWMADTGITTGTSPSTFEPYRDVTRGETATFLWRHAGTPAGGAEPFSDVEPGRYYSTAVAWMVAAGITTGTSPTTFDPDRPVTRGETATFLWRYASSPATVVDPGGVCGLPAPAGRFETLPPGAVLPSGAQCADRVRAAPEIRADNSLANSTTGSAPHPDNPRVDGNFTGTTDEILQWAACKWGIDEDMVRAQAAKESWWHQDAAGDLSYDANACHPSVRHLVPCPESLGILQVRYLYHTPAMDDSIASTAYNADYVYSIMRACYDGELTWLNTVERGATYVAGDIWGCFGVWFSGRWRTQPALGYIADVSQLLADRVWEQPYFIDG